MCTRHVAIPDEDRKRLWVTVSLLLGHLELSGVGLNLTRGERLHGLSPLHRLRNSTTLHVGGAVAANVTGLSALVASARLVGGALTHWAITADMAGLAASVASADLGAGRVEGLTLGHWAITTEVSRLTAGVAGHGTSGEPRSTTRLSLVQRAVTANVTGLIASVASAGSTAELSLRGTEAGLGLGSIGVHLGLSGGNSVLEAELSHCLWSVVE